MRTNTVKQHFSTTRGMREAQRGHKSMVIWLTGLSGAGKSTIANGVEMALHAQGIGTYLLDGDNIRQGLNKDLSFSAEDRSENIRRIAEVARLLMDAGVVVLAAFIAPYQKDRDLIRTIVGADDYAEIFVSTTLEVCESRDVKGLYERARRGEISDFTGVSSPYETPRHPDLSIDTGKLTPEEAVAQVLNYILPKLNVHE